MIVVRVKPTLRVTGADTPAQKKLETLARCDLNCAEKRSDNGLGGLLIPRLRKSFARSSIEYMAIYLETRF